MCEIYPSNIITKYKQQSQTRSVENSHDNDRLYTLSMYYNLVGSPYLIARLMFQIYNEIENVGNEVPWIQKNRLKIALRIDLKYH